MASVRRAAPVRRIGRAVAAGILTLAFVTSSATDVTASPSARLRDAKGRLTQLTERIGTEEAQARGLQDRLAELDARITAARSRIAGIDVELARTRADLAAAAAREQRLQTRLDEMARSLFIQGVGSVQASVLGELLGSSSIGEVDDLLAYGQVLSRSDVDLANEVSNLRAQLSMEKADLERLRSEQVQLESDLAAQHATQARALEDQRAVIGSLDRTRSQIVSMIARLHAEIRAQALAAVGTAFQGSGHVSYGSWAGAFVRSMRAPACRSNLVVLVAWQYSEFTQAAWNPLADTLPMSGSTGFNSAGVQNYVSLEQGLEAVGHTLSNGPMLGYPSIVAGLRACADALTTAEAINASAWCRGCAGGSYVTGWIAKIEANYALYAAL